VRAPPGALAVLATLAAIPSSAGAHGPDALGTPRAPTSPPLTAGEAGAVNGGEGAAGTEQAGADPLVSNGLGSPTCKGGLAGELSATSKRDCETSGFVAAPAPTGDYGFDVHIDTGVLGLGSGALDSAIEDLIVSPLWMALVWATHALVVMLEWCFTLDLLDSAATVGLGGALRQMQASVTEPWLPIALACASMLAVYHGLVRRRVAQTLGETLLTGAMMIAGLSLIADPTGTVGALGQWADQASLGTLAVAARGTPAGPGRALGISLGTLFTAAIEAPWCYLEFGDVGWCREPSRLDPRLRTTALRIAAQETSAIACQPSSGQPLPCVSAGSAQGRTLAQSAELLRGARTNGAIFLALPANGAARNSINEQGSLLRALCQSSDASDCRGPTAAEAAFRTTDGTLSRLGGIVLIASGLLGMLLLLGFLVARLLLAALLSLLYLLLAPAIVLAPAFGEGGRTLFRRWGAQLFGAVVSKLVFSFLLGVVLAVLGMLYKLAALGWWTQWLLMSAFWWAAFKRRHQLLGGPGAALAAEHAQTRSLVRRVGDAFETPRRGIAAARWAKDKLVREAPAGRERKLAPAGREPARTGGGELVERMLAAEHREAAARAARAGEIERQLTAKRSRLARLGRERGDALVSGNPRRAARLGHRGDRLRGEIDREQDALRAAQRVVREREQAQRRTGLPYAAQRRDAEEGFLATQAALPARGRPARTGERRDYAALAGLAGYGREEYERLDQRRQRAARAEIDRELASRSALNHTTAAFAGGPGAPRLGWRERRNASQESETTARPGTREGGHDMPRSREPRSATDHRRGAGGSESSVMRDAREVAARRKRQLGHGRQ
jgi:hypothetical protein